MLPLPRARWLTATPAPSQVANCYPKWLAEGIHVIATNKKGVAGPGKLYDQAKQARLASNPYPSPLPLTPTAHPYP